MDLLGGIVLASAENIRLGAFGVAQLVYLGLQLSVQNIQYHLPIPTIVPYVMRPTRAYAGSRLKLMIIESLSAFKLSSS